MKMIIRFSITLPVVDHKRHTVARLECALPPLQIKSMTITLIIQMYDLNIIES